MSPATGPGSSSPAAATTPWKNPSSSGAGSSKKKKIIIAGSAAALLLLAAGGGVAAWTLTGSHDSGESLLAPNEYRVVQPVDLTDSITVKGTIGAGRTAVVRTSLTVPVEDVNIKVGDRVEEGQALVVMDTSGLEEQLQSKQKAKATAAEQAAVAVEQAQRKLQQFDERQSQGFSEQLNGATAAVEAADRAYQQAKSDYDLAASQRAAQTTPEIVAQTNAVDSARKSLFNATLGAIRAGVGSAVDLTGTKNTGPDNPNGSPIPQAAINTHLSTVDAAAGVVSANKNLTEAQRSLNATLQSTDRALAQKQQAVADAFEKKRAATVALEAAKLGQSQSREDLVNAVADAQRAAANSDSDDGSEDKIRRDIGNATVRAPFGGIVTSVSATAGTTPGTQLATIADTDTYTITANVKEIDLTHIKTGQPVEITTPLTGDTTFAGSVTTISPVAAGSGAAAASSGGTNVGPGPSDSSSPSFAVEITLTGPTDGLRLGGSAKAKIITAKTPGALTVSQDALIDRGDGTQALLVLDKQGVVRERTVTTGERNDFDIAITDGLAAGDTVINQGKTHRNLVGTSPSLVPQPDSDAK